MTKLNHSRPSLKLADNLKREASAAREQKDDRRPILEPNPFLNAEPAFLPETDSRLDQSHVLQVRSLLDAFQVFVMAYGMSSPILGKVTAKKRRRLDKAVHSFVEASAEFIGFCVREPRPMPMSAWDWFMEYCEQYRRNRNPLYPMLAAVLEDGLANYLHWLKSFGSEEDNANFSLFRERVGASA